MPSPRTLARLDAATWALIYGGLFGIVLAIVTGGSHVVAGWSLGVLGSIAVAAGIVLIIVRSRLPGAAAPGAQSNETRRQGPP